MSTGRLCQAQELDLFLNRVPYYGITVRDIENGAHIGQVADRALQLFLEDIQRYLSMGNGHSQFGGTYLGVDIVITLKDRPLFPV